MTKKWPTVHLKIYVFWTNSKHHNFSSLFVVVCRCFAIFHSFSMFFSSFFIIFHYFSSFFIIKSSFFIIIHPRSRREPIVPFLTPVHRAHEQWRNKNEKCRKNAKNKTWHKNYLFLTQKYVFDTKHILLTRKIKNDKNKNR